MTELSNDPGIQWSYPSPAPDGTTDGFVFMGNKAATEEDFEALRTYTEDGTLTRDNVDGPSLVGLYGRSWTSNFYSKATGGDKPGGEGSEAYESQMWGGGGCEFKDYPVWHYTAGGDLVKEIPANCGEVYKKPMGGGYYDLIAGVEPGSNAEDYLDGDEMVWDEENAYYVKG